jgi:hypothetical protein
MESARIVNVPWPAPRRELLTALLVGGLAALTVVVLLLLARRMAGALVQPLGGLELVAVASLGLLLTTGWRLGWQARGSSKSSLARAAPALPGIALFLLLCVLTLPGTAPWALMLTWLSFLAGETVWWWTAYATLRPPATRGTVPPGSIFQPAAVDHDASNESPLPSDLFQQITRYQEGEQERVAVMLRISFSAGQRVAVAHVAFCPPLFGITQLAAETTDGPSATVAITHSQSFGVRLEVRLEEPADEVCAVVVEVEGHSPLDVLSSSLGV